MKIALVFPLFYCACAGGVMACGCGLSSDLIKEGQLPDCVSTPQVTPMKASGTDGVRIAWDYGSERKLSNKGGYARILRLQDGSHLAVFEDHNGNVVQITTDDDGQSWSAAKIVIPKYTYSANGVSTVVNVANAEIIQLKDGSLICGANYRPATAGIAPYAIVISRSFDKGNTWGAPHIVYQAGTTSENGCWEPAFLQLPDGEVQLYFANEAPYTASSEQEISMLVSFDGGATWRSQTRQVSFRASHRDGMPVPALFEDEIVVAVEDNGSGPFKPATVRCKISDDWSEAVSAYSPNRQYALSDRVDDKVYMGAPYLLRLPSGDALISYQTNENRSPNWEYSTMEVAVGDKNACHFTRRTRPFDVAIERKALWNSVALWDNHTIFALSSTDKDGAMVAPWMKRGYLITPFTAEKETVSQYPVFVGNAGENTLLAGVAVSNANLSFSFSINDKTKAQKDGVFLYLDPINDLWAKPYGGIYKIWIGRDGNLRMWEGNNGNWQEIAVHNVKVNVLSTDQGYKTTLAIDKKHFDRMNMVAIRIALALSAYDSESNGYEEILVCCNPNKPCSWLEVNL